MTDRELLEKAAKAAGGTLQWEDGVPWFIGATPGKEYEWDPLTDDGDALRLMIKLRIQTVPGDMLTVKAVSVQHGVGALAEVQIHKHHSSDEAWLAATRKAIVGCAAEIGRKMP